MTLSGPSASRLQDPPAFLDEALLARLEAIPEPALIYLPGGRIAAINSAAARLAEIPIVGMTVDELIERYETRRADGRPLISANTPYARALRGEHVVHGERFDATRSDGSVYRMVATSTPIIVDGTVVAALSVWHDFDEDLRSLAGLPER